jgi:hypothetical protein
MKRLALALVALLAAALLAPVAAALEEPSPPAPGLRMAPESIALATYHGRTIDLREGWQGAGACHVSAQAVTTCFDTEEEMDAFTGYREVTTGPVNGLRAACSSTLKLYDGISYGGGVAQLDLRFTVINLSSVGFDNATTSYKVGACSSTFWQGSGASGSVYPGNTSAFAQSPNMVTGWNNTVSSVYIA